MEHIRKAIERAKGPQAADTQSQAQLGLASLQPQINTYAGTAGLAQSLHTEVTLSTRLLESNRIISHDVEDPRSKSFDILRTQILQTMDMKSWQLLGITSPTADCGKSMIAINLALSIARQSDRSVLLVDMDLQRPQVAKTLGLKCAQGLLSVLEGRTNLSSALIQASIKNQNIWVLPCEASTLSSSEWMASRPMSALLQDIKRDFKGWTVILDLPPTLMSDDVLSLLPQIDCVLLVTAVGTSTISQIKECNRHLESTPIVRVVLNKAIDTAATYYYSQYANDPASRGKTPKKSSGNRSRSGRPNAPPLKWAERVLDRIVRF